MTHYLQPECKAASSHSFPTAVCMPQPPSLQLHATVRILAVLPSPMTPLRHLSHIHDSEHTSRTQLGDVQGWASTGAPAASEFRWTQGPAHGSGLLCRPRCRWLARTSPATLRFWSQLKTGKARPGYLLPCSPAKRLGLHMHEGLACPMWTAVWLLLGLDGCLRQR